MNKSGWFAIVLGTILFFLGVSFAVALNFTGAWIPNAWRYVTDQSVMVQLFVFLLFNADFFGVIISITGILLFSFGIIVLNQQQLAWRWMYYFSWVFLVLSVVLGLGLIFFSTQLLGDSPFQYMTSSIKKGTIWMFVFLGLVILFVSGLPWILFLYFLRRDGHD